MATRYRVGDWVWATFQKKKELGIVRSIGKGIGGVTLYFVTDARGVMQLPFIASELRLYGRKNPVHPQAIESLKRYKDDLKAGHKDAAEFWRGQAGAYFTANPNFYQKVNQMYREGYRLEGNFYQMGLPKVMKELKLERKLVRKIKVGGFPGKYCRWAVYSKTTNPLGESLIAGLGTGAGFGVAFYGVKKLMKANPLTRKIGGQVYTWINDYDTRLKAQREASRWLRDGFSAKIVVSRRKRAMYPYQLYVAEGSRRTQTTGNPLTGVPLSKMNKSDVAYYHAHHHSWAKYAKTRARYTEVKRSHDRVVREMKRRGIQHLSPL